MGEKPGKVPALVVEFSADFAASRAKSGEGSYSEALHCWRKGVYISYTEPGSGIGLTSIGCA